MRPELNIIHFECKVEMVATATTPYNHALFMLNEYTKNSKYRRFAELLMLLSNIQEIMSTISLDKIFFRHLINRISMQNLLNNIIHHLPTFFR